MSRPPSQTTPQICRVSDKDLTEIELHSVDSINDLHRTHPEHNRKVQGQRYGLLLRELITGTRPPRPAYTPSANGTPHARRTSAGAKRQSRRLRDTSTPSSSRACAAACAVIALLLLTLALIFYFLVQQGGALRRLTEASRDKEAAAARLSALIRRLQTLAFNLTAARGRT
ncbi:uncharacterized protein si:dkey-20d21.12 isoform X1 [Phyllopteryx taeniolatus]|uniref:uncharacterized protein si:dkey-20d21.12 isoform X1 n=1 Tax=Phyllopteryx taeniolatus TaxID=161469 RepID=UPI002AD1FB65|nr:uncharacterized protein si:dkey-20d21.12 isoform X1 [Phyllopteryx taeniolatus]